MKEDGEIKDMGVRNQKHSLTKRHNSEISHLGKNHNVSRSSIIQLRGTVQEMKLKKRGNVHAHL